MHDGARAAMESAELLRHCVDAENYDEYLEAARYIARRNG